MGSSKTEMTLIVGTRLIVHARRQQAAAGHCVVIGSMRDKRQDLLLPCAAFFGGTGAQARIKEPP